MALLGGSYWKVLHVELLAITYFLHAQCKTVRSLRGHTCTRGLNPHEFSGHALINIEINRTVKANDKTDHEVSTVRALSGMVNDPL